MSDQPPASRPPPDDLLPWASQQLAPAVTSAGLVPVAGDASNRRYFRLAVEGGSVIVLESPPATEKNAAFLAIRAVLEATGVPVPRLLAEDRERGYLLLEDLGDALLLGQLDDASVDGWYEAALDLSLRLARVEAATAGVPAYDRDLLAEELGRLPDWFLERLLGLSLSGEERDLLARTGELLVENALAQPRVLVHRDFHSRNLMVREDGSLVVIDFQDAVTGPVTYDPASLLKDCYIRWPRQRVVAWALAHRDRLAAAGVIPAVPDPVFLQWFDLMGLQRHLKVLGTFARLNLRDGKAGYLDDLPLVLAYVEETLADYAGSFPVLAAFHDWWRSRVQPAVARQPWSRPA